MPFFYTVPATTDIYTLSLHDALPISPRRRGDSAGRHRTGPSTVSRHRLVVHETVDGPVRCRDRKSTRLNSSHTVISYAVFCLKKKKIIREETSSRHRCNS